MTSNPPSKGKATSNKPVIKLGSPYTETKWPAIPASYQDTILQLLVDLVTPAGRYRSDHVIASKGKRAKKRKRDDVKAYGTADNRSRAVEHGDGKHPPPAISEHIIIGYNCIVRHLEGLLIDDEQARKEDSDVSNDNKAPKEERETAMEEDIQSSKAKGHAPRGRLSAIYLTHSPATYLPYQHLPALITTTISSKSMPAYNSNNNNNNNNHAASHKPPSSEDHPDPQPPPHPILLVPLPSNIAEQKLAAALGIARVGIIGVLHDAPGAEALLGYTREHVPETHVPWLRKAGEVKWMGTNIVIEEGGKSR